MTASSTLLISVFFERVEGRSKQHMAYLTADCPIFANTKKTTFLRDYFNCFWEAVLACDHLETIRGLIQSTVPTASPDRRTRIIIFWSEAYLNEMYIFQLRLLDFLTASERRYKNDPDFAAPMREICTGLRAQVQKALEPLIKIRG